MYKLPASLLYANPLNRYLIYSPMLQSLKRDPDGGITLYLQNVASLLAENPWPWTGNGSSRPYGGPIERKVESRCCASSYGGCSRCRFCR
jgi:hypothetical protein